MTRPSIVFVLGAPRSGTTLLRLMLAGVPEALPRLARWFPDARYLWIVRHPGSVIRSLQSVNLAESLRTSYGDPETVWRRGNETMRDFLATIPRERWTRFQYEEMVRAP